MPEVPRSTLYARRARAKLVPLHPKRGGLKPEIADDALVEAITLCQFALNLLRREPSCASVKRKRLKAALNDDFRAKLVFGQ